MNITTDRVIIRQAPAWRAFVLPVCEAVTLFAHLSHSVCLQALQEVLPSVHPSVCLWADVMLQMSPGSPLSRRDVFLGMPGSVRCAVCCT